MLLYNLLLLLVGLPVLILYWLVAHLLAWIITFTVIPSRLLSRKLNWACPFIPQIWLHMGHFRGTATRIGFEASYCINFFTRLFTLPIRTGLPSFYIVGFPKCGTTSLAEHLKRHPALSGTAGLPYHEALSKESHFFEGVLGPKHAHQGWLYRTFFPTLISKWWAEKVLGVGKWMCFDACPVHACLPYVAKRMAKLTPEAKIIVMLRNPVQGLFSAEIMFRDMGIKLPWKSLTEELTHERSLGASLTSGGPGRLSYINGDDLTMFDDPRFDVRDEAVSAWQSLYKLEVEEDLPYSLPEFFYFHLYSHMKCGEYAPLIEQYYKYFPPENIMVVNFSDFILKTELVVKEVLHFVGADSQHFTYQTLHAGMKGNYHGLVMHPTVASALTAHYRPSVERLQQILGKDLGWEGFEGLSVTKTIPQPHRNASEAGSSNSASTHQTAGLPDDTLPRPDQRLQQKGSQLFRSQKGSGALPPEETLVTVEEPPLQAGCHPLLGQSAIVNYPTPHSILQAAGQYGHLVTSATPSPHLALQLICPDAPVDSDEDAGCEAAGDRSVVAGTEQCIVSAATQEKDVAVTTAWGSPHSNMTAGMD
ncbi:hypothetical protein CEUSTIGMA_g4427.t1 [Chlamydomonas eustigma]|uniref:Sulfotransferase n=1 Tax=Chlamydomonas eustigma TaxID=1157962 RepID=A0A250X2K1_9CHLO|nr:hypothetical protein CEUSTIGMA_g4427.t1 [Chlamydomonas eustigma]|eukprot:GAX76980.1 hypothetical protein CEUSTIGMA_g4427.t1 [Chlamydomonas eustigma]